MSFVSSPIGSSRPGSGSNPTPGPMLKLMSNETVGGTTDQALNCPICNLHLRNPRVLPCLHSFCLHCLQVNVGQSRHFPCPVCRLQVSLDDNNTLDNLPMNTYFSGLFDLGDSIDNGIDSSTGTRDAFASSTQMKKFVPAVKRPPLRQPFFNGSGVTSVDPVGDRKHSQDMASSSSSLNSYLPVWPSSASENSIWRNQFDFSMSALGTGSSSDVLAPAAIATTTVDLPLATVVSNSGWQMLDGTRALPPDPNEREPLKNAFANVLETAAAVAPPSSTSWSSVVGTKPCSSSSSSSYPPPGFSKASTNTKLPTCSSCDDKQLVTSRCRDCNEDLCDSCVDAHQRVSLTRHHVIVRYPETSSSSLTTVTNPSFSLMSGLPQPTTPLFGFPRDSDVMKVYADAVEKAKADCDKLMFKARQGKAQIEDAKSKVADMEARVDMRYKSVYADINSIVENYLTEIKNRGQVLLSRLESIHQVKMASLAHQKRELSSTTICLAQVADQLASCSMSGRELDLINACNKAMSTIKEVQSKCGTLAIHEEDTILFEAPNPTFIKSLANFGFVGGSAFAPNSSAEGEGLKKATLGKDARFVVCVRDQLNEQCQNGGELVKISILDPESRQVRYNIADCQNGLYKVNWKPVMEGDHLLSVTIKDRHIKDSPFRVRVRTGRNYSNIGTPVFTFGIEGEKDGELCRPWGVCCSREGYILVANRSNNRIEVFSAQGTFLYKFGTGGKQDGQFDRPASVCCDTKNRVIITDKDNHRVQIFTIEGKFLLTFGEKGSKPGQFNYPWDVACNSKDQILVSDTRNHRIQLFSPNGEYLNKYGFEGAMWKHFDSPRGVCFTADDQAVVTDFNNHRLLVVKADFQGAQFLGKEGTEDGAFTRPNGVAVDEEGHIIVADSRNDRIQIFSSSGAFVKRFGGKGTGPGEFDRPSGICISQDGLVIVVDFGNNRVQVF